MKKQMKMSGIGFYLLVLAVIFCAVYFSGNIESSSSDSYSIANLKKDLGNGNVTSASISQNQEIPTGEVVVKLKSGKNVDFYVSDVKDVQELLDQWNVSYKLGDVKKTSWVITTLLPYGLGFVAIFLLFSFLSAQSANSGGGNSKMMNFGKSRARRIDPEEPHAKRFKDVAGLKEEKEELEEIVDFLANPGRYTDVGARIPKGIILVGPPGTGKTLLAKAVAGEAGVPFFSLAGSDFVEMFVGVGASRVRDLFKEAQKMAPCIIFIDEIDAIGKSRDSRYGGGNDEREQTLNQLLAEMDGFDTSKGLLILAATNRPEVLDKALLRPGRFDRRIIVDKPDLKGRLETLKVHSKDVKMDESVDLDALALATAGLVGSDLANMINEAAINAVKNGRQLVNQSDLFEAFELVAVGGKEKKDRVMSDKERKIVSYHEVGHALVSALQKNTEPVQKITIVPRTMGALGYTLQTPEEEKYLETKDELLAKITTYMAGRAAEVLVFNSVTSGAANDIENATKIARAMVTMYGMSDKFGMMCLATVQNQYLEGGAGLICGENTASQIDDEVLSIINSSYAEAMKLLDENREILDSISDYLYQKETITGKEFMKMFRDMKGLPDPDEEKDGEESKEQENAQNDAQKDTTSAADPLLRNATDQPADTNESSEYTAPDDNTLNN